jgi:hypothetical protein
MKRVNDERRADVAARTVTPAPLVPALAALVACALRVVGLLARRRLRQPDTHVAWRLGFADGTTAAVYRETIAERPPSEDPVVLVVEFRLRWVRHPFFHTLFRWESVLNTVLFAGFPGFVSKLWMRDDEEGCYRGLYDWDSARLAESYVSALWWPLVVVAEPASIRFVVLPAMRRDEVLSEPSCTDTVAPAEARAWWRLVTAAPPSVVNERGT